MRFETKVSLGAALCGAVLGFFMGAALITHFLEKHCRDDGFFVTGKIAIRCSEVATPESAWDEAREAVKGRVHFEDSEDCRVVGDQIVCALEEDR